MDPDYCVHTPPHRSIRCTTMPCNSPQHTALLWSNRPRPLLHANYTHHQAWLQMTTLRIGLPRALSGYNGIYRGLRDLLDALIVNFKLTMNAFFIDAPITNTDRESCVVQDIDDLIQLDAVRVESDRDDHFPRIELRPVCQTRHTAHT